MYHTVNVRVRLEDLVKVLLLSNVDMNEFRALATNELDAIDSLFGGIEEIVCDYDFIVCLKECKGGERSNVARPPERFSAPKR